MDAFHTADLVNVACCRHSFYLSSYQKGCQCKPKHSRPWFMWLFNPDLTGDTFHKLSIYGSSYSQAVSGSVSTEQVHTTGAHQPIQCMQRCVEMFWWQERHWEPCGCDSPLCWPKYLDDTADQAQHLSGLLNHQGKRDSSTTLTGFQMGST